MTDMKMFQMMEHFCLREGYLYKVGFESCMPVAHLCKNDGAIDISVIVFYNDYNIVPTGVFSSNKINQNN